MVRGGLTYFEAKARIASQLPTAEKAARATYVVVNDMSERELTPQVDEVWCKLNTSQACN